MLPSSVIAFEGCGNGEVDLIRNVWNGKTNAEIRAVDRSAGTEVDIPRPSPRILSAPIILAMQQSPAWPTCLALMPKRAFREQKARGDYLAGDTYA
jgi:hypothetical protein